MDYSEFKRLVFASIAKHDGAWSWYQLDRALIRQHPEMSSSLMLALKNLEAEGLIQPVLPEGRPGQPLYMLTERGKNYAG